jgi:hypothetical protein
VFAKRCWEGLLWQTYRLLTFAYSRRSRPSRPVTWSRGTQKTLGPGFFAWHAFLWC